MILSKAVTGEAISLSVGNGSYDAYPVDAGCTHVELKAGERNYFLFTPTQAGTYEFSAADGANVTLGYYGAPHFVQSNNAAEDVSENGTFRISVSASMIGKGDTGTTVLVIGVDSDSATECIHSGALQTNLGIFIRQQQICQNTLCQKAQHLQLLMLHRHILLYITRQMVTII